MPSSPSATDKSKCKIGNRFCSRPCPLLKQLYNSLNRTRSNILAQLRTGHSWLASYSKIMKKTESDKCECGARETTIHVLAHCPKLRVAREKLRKKIGKRFNAVSLMLGGKPYYCHPKSKKWKIPKKDLEAVLDFAQRFISRAAITPLHTDYKQPINSRICSKGHT
jgi:hypothetical protein